MTQEQITDTNCIICGDCRDQLARIPNESVDLIYLDPPFFRGKIHDIIWKDGAEKRTFLDTKFYTIVCKCGEIFPDNNNFCGSCGAGRDEIIERESKDDEVYLRWLRPRLERCRDVLKDTGSIYVHLDYHAAHYVKVMMDEIFGYDNFQNDIIWCFQGGWALKRRFKRKHDIILFYSKDRDYTFNPQHKKGVRRGVKKDGKIRPVPVFEDWWVDIPAMNMAPHNRERLGYPTQKPEALLERIIKASSNPGDVILDPFCGCGTTLAVAQKLGRKWIGIDVSPTSTKVMINRLQRIGVEITEADIIDLPWTCTELRKMEPFEFQNLVIAKMNGKQNRNVDINIVGWTRKRNEYGIGYEVGFNAMVQVKRSDRIGKQTIHELVYAMSIDTYTDGKHGIIVAFSFSKSAREYVKVLEMETEITIDLITVKELFDCE